MGKNKTLINIITIIICIVVAALCIFAYISFSKKEANNTKKTSNNTKTEKISTEPIFTEDNYPVVDGSTATIPLAEAFYKDFTGVEKEIEHSKTHEAYVKLVDKDVDLILVVEPSEDDEEYAENNNVVLKADKIVNEAFVFFVNNDNPVDELTIDQIKDIYSGKITNWKDVGGNDEPIVAYQRPVNSGSQTGMLNLVMDGTPMMEPETNNVAQSMFDIIGVVSDYENGQGAIGYSYYYYANTMVDEEVKMIKVNGIEPNNENIKAEKYPIMTAYYAVTREDDASTDTIKLLNEMLSTRGQKVVEEAGYVPVK